jgi:hypothetical protein
LVIESKINEKIFYGTNFSSFQEFDEMQKVFPIWGTCLGFETLLMLTRRSTNILDHCKGYNFATELNFTAGNELDLIIRIKSFSIIRCK